MRLQIKNRRSRLSSKEQSEFSGLLGGWADSPKIVEMKKFIQHGSVDTYSHCKKVAETSFWLSRRLHMKVDEKSLVRGALLHDFYLYDWHDGKPERKRHGFTHPLVALANADREFSLNDIERNIIGSHMWPLTLRRVPRCKEAVLVCLADKQCSLIETLFCRR